MCQPGEGCTGQTVAAQHLGLVLERQVRREDQTDPFVGCAKDVEQQLGPGLAGRHVAE